MTSTQPDRAEHQTGLISSNRPPGPGLVLGLGIGLALGVTLEDIPVWLGVGAGPGVAFEAAARRGDF